MVIWRASINRFKEIQTKLQLKKCSLVSIHLRSRCGQGQLSELLLLSTSSTDVINIYKLMAKRRILLFSPVLSPRWQHKSQQTILLTAPVSTSLRTAWLKSTYRSIHSMSLRRRPQPLLRQLRVSVDSTDGTQGWAWWSDLWAHRSEHSDTWGAW